MRFQIQDLLLAAIMSAFSRAAHAARESPPPKALTILDGLTAIDGIHVCVAFLVSYTINAELAQEHERLFYAGLQKHEFERGKAPWRSDFLDLYEEEGIWDRFSPASREIVKCRMKDSEYSWSATEVSLLGEFAENAQQEGGCTRVISFAVGDKKARRRACNLTMALIFFLGHISDARDDQTLQDVLLNLQYHGPLEDVSNPNWHRLVGQSEIYDATMTPPSAEFLALDDEPQPISPPSPMVLPAKPMPATPPEPMVPAWPLPALPPALPPAPPPPATLVAVPAPPPPATPVVVPAPPPPATPVVAPTPPLPPRLLADVTHRGYLPQVPRRLAVSKKSAKRAKPPSVPPPVDVLVAGRGQGVQALVDPVYRSSSSGAEQSSSSGSQPHRVTEHEHVPTVPASAKHTVSARSFKRSRKS